MIEPEYKRDIEETDQVLDAAEVSPIEFWEKKQRELITSVVDYNLGTLADLIHTKAIDLSPEYQRRFRWDATRQSKLIESFLMNVPVPPIFLNEDAYGQYSVIDGKQRLNTVYEFLRGRLQLKDLEIFSDINGSNFDNLPSRLQTVIRTRPTLRAVIILRQSDEDVKFEVFQRLNTGGVRLNPQEIRNSTYTGPLNNLILDLSTQKQFHRLLGIKNKEQSAIYQEMRDAEFVLRFFTFRDSWQTFSGGMKRQMDRFMANNRYAPTDFLSELKSDFLRAITTVELCFGEHAFQRWLPERKVWKRQVLASLYDAQMFACREYSPEKVKSKQDRILASLQQLFLDKEFRRSIDAATNTPTFFVNRILVVKGIIQSALIEK
jgi:Protein of unknown function DUF262